MSDIAIRVEDLSKQYQIGERQQQYRTLRDALAEGAATSLRRMRSLVQGGRRKKSSIDNTIWALKNVSFEIRRGEVAGIIGRNGAGKSTLLKVLSRITTPSEGSAEIHGRVGSLLEVGTGFHAELTGRENIFLNGAILGMHKSEIKRKFDEIVAFAEVERFIDTPVKYYSTGMYMRLAFAVAAHLEPEILLVDEVLAVGDAAFQKKCLGKMGEVAEAGRTVLFVSHNMPAVQSLCKRCLVFDSGQLRCAGSLQQGIRIYHELLHQKPTVAATAAELAIANLRINDQEAPHVVAGEPLLFEFDVISRVEFSGFRLFLLLESPQGVIVLHCASDEQELPTLTRPGISHVRLRVPALWLAAGVYSAHAKIICAGVGLKGRYLSDKILVIVDSLYDPGTVAGMLTPPIEWEAMQN